MTVFAFPLLERQWKPLAAGGLTVFICFCFWTSLPDPLFDDPFSSVLLDREGRLLDARLASDEQWRFPHIENVPSRYRTALLAFEDKRFPYHPGFDPFALIRALYLNISEGRVVSGGSTLTMQVIRMARKQPERTYKEKLIEIVLALRLEMGYSKEEILEFYASHAPFGGNVVGLEAASWRYFGRSPEQLGWAEVSLLAVLPNSPSLIHPGRNRSLLKEKRDKLLRQLSTAGSLSSLDLQLALAEPLPEAPVPLPHLAPHLLTRLISEADSHRFTSTLDRRLQKLTTERLHQRSVNLTLRDIYNVAAIVIDNENAEVLAYVGNNRLQTTLGSKHISERGHAVDIIRSPRSTGSLLKPLLFAAMLESGDILPDTLVSDVPTQYGGYMPENFDRQYRGAVSAKNALARSLNVPAVRMLNAYGIDRFYDQLRNLGMQTLFRTPDGYGLSLILGGAEGTLWDMAAIYSNLAMLASQPVIPGEQNYRSPIVEKGKSSDTNRLVDLSPGAAWLTLQALLEVSRPGVDANWRNFGSSRKVAWKTGTSFGMRDAWAIGITPGYTVAVWVGNASGEGKPELTGVSVAAPVMFDLFNLLKPSDWFDQPYASMKEVAVCKNDGYLANGQCESQRIWIPKNSHFDRISPYNRAIHLDKAGIWRVHSLCETVFEMKQVNWFKLSPVQENYYRRTHSDYRTLPEWRADCREEIAAESKQDAIDLLYPASGANFYIPMDLGQEKSRVVFEAVHADPAARLFWHLDETYLGETRRFHQLALDIEAGDHRLVLVDQKGDRLSRQFRVLSE